MPATSLLNRLKAQLYALVQQNDVSDAMLIGPSEVLSRLDGSVDMLLEGGRYLERGLVTITSSLDTLVQVPVTVRLDALGQPVSDTLVDWTALFQVGDEIILGGSSLGNNGRRIVSAVTPVLNGQSEVIGYTITTSTPFVAEESGLVYGKPTFSLRQLCRELLLYPGGYETDQQLRTLLSTWLETMQLRGTRAGVETEVDRLTNSTSTELLETVTPLVELGTNLSYQDSSREIALADPDLYIGQPVTVAESSEDSNGRYTVYSNSGSAVVLGHRASRSRFYRDVHESSVTEVQFREDRVNQKLWVRLINTAVSAEEVEVGMSVAAATVTSADLAAGSGSTASTASTATLTLTTSGGSVATPSIAEAVISLSGTSDSTTFTVTINSGTPTQVFLGSLSLCPTGVDGSPVLAQIQPWRWGAVVRTGLRSRSDETGLTLLASARPGWYLGLSTPDSAEEDAYTMASPDEFVVVETDHRNTTNYTEQDLETLVRDVMLPADVDGALGLT